MIDLERIINNKADFAFKLHGLSMFPFLQSGDIVYFKKTNFKKITINDLALIKKNGIFFAHRVIYKNEKYLVTRGYNNLFSDGKIRPGQIFGKAYKIKRGRALFNLKDIYLIQSTIYFDELNKVKKKFDKNNINYVFLKGLPTYLFYYKIHPERIFGDCDILVSYKDLEKTKAILLAYGYQHKKTYIEKILGSKKGNTEISYYKKKGIFNVVFDIHIKPAFMLTQIDELGFLYPDKNINNLTKILLTERQKVTLYDENYWLLNPVHLILYLALHLFHHNLRGVYRYRILDTILRKEISKKNTLPHLAELIKKYELQGFSYPAFVLLIKYFNSPIPTSFLKSIEPGSFFQRFCIAKLLGTNIFDSEPQFSGGIKRFLLVFFLSPVPLWRRIGIFFNSKILSAIYNAFIMKIKQFFSFSGR